MPKGQIDLEIFRQAMEDSRLWLSYAKVTKVDILDDRSAMKADVQLLPSEYDARVRVGAEYVAPGVGMYYPLRANDLVLVGFPSGDPEHGVVVKRLASAEDTIPEEFDNDKVVLKITDDEEFVLVGNTMLFGSDGSTENVVLGQVFKSMMSTVLGALAVHKHISSPPGFLSFIPDNAATYTSKKASPVDDEAILSDKSYTEK